MALNYSHRPIFPAHLPDDNLAAPIRIANGCLVEGMPERKADGFVRPWLSSLDVDDCFQYGGGGINNFSGGDSQESSVPKDVIDLLPADPFGMDISSTFTAISGWLEDLEVGCGGYRRAEVGTIKTDYPLFADWNFIWNKAMGIQTFSGSSGVCGEDMVIDNEGGQGFGVNEFGMSLGNHHVGSVSNFGELSSINEDASLSEDQYSSTVSAMCVDVDDECAHPALPFALGYLGVRDLLAVERACKSLHDTVWNDSLLWRTIHIGKPLNERLTDDILLNLTKRAHGNLQCLSLVECKITDDCLRRILESNPRLTKLSVPGCTKITIDGILGFLRVFNAVSVPGIKYLRIGGVYNVSQKHFEEMKALLGMDDRMSISNRKPFFYRREDIYLSSEDDRAIDIETCPRCQNIRLVYDCPAETCRAKQHDDVCRGCTFCIPRCGQCGRCINDVVFEETFSLDWQCSDCWKQTVQCDERLDSMVSSSEPVIHEGVSFSYHG